MKHPLRQWLLGLVLVVTAAADQVELVEGSVVKGRIVSVESGKLRIETSFAGSIAIPLEQVRAFATTDQVNVSVAGSPVVLGHVYATDTGVQLQSDAVRVAATPGQVTALWRQGAESPGEKIAREKAEKAKRKWSYEATVAVTGRTGTSDKLNATVGGKATFASDHDRLIFTGTVERAQDTGVQTANREFAGVDYSWFYSPDHGWYARTSLETDKIKALDLRSTSALGITRKVLRKANEDLELRLGVSYTYENYSTATEFESPGADVSLLNSLTLKGAKLNTTLQYVPAFRDTDNYRLRHETNLEVPITVSLWKLKIGVTNEYQNIPPAGVDRFDTTYFTSLLLNWK